MAKRAGIWAAGAVAVLVLWPVAFGMADTDGNALVPPAGELWIAGLSLALVAGADVRRRLRRAVATAAPVPRG